MLHGLARLLPRITAERLDESAIYQLERLYRRPTPGRVRPGVLLCPICGAAAMRFAPYGLDGRRNAQCPSCGSLERHRMLWLYLERRTRLLERRLRLLHTAPEACLEPRLRALPNLAVVTVDRFNPFADIAADLTDLPFPDGRFDLVISSHVLEHVPQDELAMAELARVLRPGGRAIVMVPIDWKRPATEEGRDVASPSERLARFGHPYHYRIYGRDVTERLGRAGFAVAVQSSHRLFGPHLRRRYRINRNLLLDCRKMRG